jgi:uncharacterized protein (DUF983 family)
VQWYDCLKVTVRRSVENAIETAHNNISSPPRPVSSGTAPEYEDTEGRQPSTPDVPSYHKPSSTEAARLLQKRCPACFGGRMKGRSFDECVVLLDAVQSSSYVYILAAGTAMWRLTVISIIGICRVHQTAHHSMTRIISYRRRRWM